MPFPDKIKNIDKVKYLSSIGMMKACDQNQIINYIDPWSISIDWNKLIAQGKEGSIVYVKFANIQELVQNIDVIPFKFILVTGDGDEVNPCSLLNIDTFFNIVNNEKIIKWYSVNCIECLHFKFSLIPIGLNYHCDALWKNMPIEFQEFALENIREKSLHFSKRIFKCYSNFHFSFYNEFGNPRQIAINKIDPNLIFYEPTKVSKENTYSNQSQYSFVISPLGHGMDCHRTWEALILGCILIVQTSPLDSLYKDLPVLIMNDWSDLTEDLLKTTIKNFENKKFNYDKLTLKYWVDKIVKVNAD